VSQGALVVSGVLVARALGPTDRGYLALLFLLPMVLQQAGTLGLPLATTYFIARDPAEERHVKRVVAFPSIAQCALLIVIQAVVLWALVRDEPSSVRDAAVVSLAVLAGSLSDIYGKAILQGQRRYAAFNVLWNGTVVLYMVGVLGLVAADAADLFNISVAWVVANLLAGALSLGVALRHRASVPQRDTGPSLRTVARFGLRGWLGTLSPVTTFRLDQAVVGLFLAPVQLGLYVAALAFTNLPTFISRGVAMVALPQVARAGRGSGDVRTFFVTTMVLTGAVIVVLELTAGWLVPLFFGQDFEAAVPITRILLVSSFFYGARRVLADAVSGAGRPELGSIAELSSWIVLLPLLLVLTPLWDVEGVAAALAISSAASLAVLLALLRRPHTLSDTPAPSIGVELDA
jgi:O-antigen/teichoic acid export membrane protein